MVTITTPSNTITLGEDIIISITDGVSPYILEVNNKNVGAYGDVTGLIPLVDGNIVYTPTDIGTYEIWVISSDGTYSDTLTVSVVEYHWYTDIVEAVKTSVWNKITSSISAHNSSNSAHSDIRNNIPTASVTTPSADTTNGAIGSGTTWAKADHTHPKSSLYAEASHTHNNYLTSHQDLSNYMQKSSTTGLMKNDGTVDTNTYLTSSSLSNYVQKSSTTGLIKNDGTIDTNTYSQTNHTHSSLTGIEIPLGADLNDYTTEGYYYHSPGQYSNVLHTPVTMLTGFKLIVSTRTHPNGTIIKNQIFINEVTNTIYIRDSHTKTEYWSDWYHFYTPNTNPIVSSFSNQLSDNNIPSEKLVKNSLDAKQDTLVSGTNIKSINGSSLIGSGNLTINPTLNGYCDDGESGYNIFEDTNGNQMFFMDYKLAFDFDTEKIYYDPFNLYNYSSNMEIATIGDIPNISGKANSSDFDTLTATVTYTDNTSETVTFYIVPSNNNG